MKLKYILILVVLSAFVSMRVFAFDVKGESKTYLGIAEDSENNRLFPLYEYLSFDINNAGNKDVSFNFGGWARQDLANKSFNDNKFNGDVQYAYFSLNKKKRNTRINLGRMSVCEGISSENIDGVYARTDLIHGFALSAYGGIPLETNFDTRNNDYIYGSRLSYEAPNQYILGVSYLDEKNDGTDFREEAGIDVWYLPVDKIEITGNSVYDPVTSVWGKHDYLASLSPFKKLKLYVNSTWITYEDYFTSMTTDAFEFSPGIIEQGEKAFMLGGQGEYSFTNNFIVSADYKKYNYKIAGDADYYGAQTKYFIRNSWRAGFDLHRMEGADESLRYYQSRLYVYKNYGRVNVTLDFSDINYDERINDVKNAFTAVSSVDYNLRNNVRLIADIEYSHNPNFNKDVKGFLKFVYTFNAKVTKEGEKI